MVLFHTITQSKLLGLQIPDDNTLNRHKYYCLKSFMMKRNEVVHACFKRNKRKITKHNFRPNFVADLNGILFVCLFTST